MKNNEDLRVDMHGLVEFQRPRGMKVFVCHTEAVVAVKFPYLLTWKMKRTAEVRGQTYDFDDYRAHLQEKQATALAYSGRLRREKEVGKCA
jgi:hypothetical protein